jgi:hypothetical protein
MSVVINILYFIFNMLNIFCKICYFFIKILTLSLFYEILCQHRLIENFQNKET